MHTNHEGRETGVITMVCSGGMFIVGNLIGGNKLVNPRLFMLIEDGKRIQMSPLPANPSFIILGNDGFRYVIPENERNILDLYDRVTHPITQSQQPVEPSNLIKLQ